jgi:hypothetical protein
VSLLLAFGFDSDFEAKDSGTENELLSVPFPFQVKHLNVNLSEEFCDLFLNTLGVSFTGTRK